MATGCLPGGVCATKADKGERKFLAGRNGELFAIGQQQVESAAASGKLVRRVEDTAE